MREVTINLCGGLRFLVGRQHPAHPIVESAHLLFHLENHRLESSPLEGATFSVERGSDASQILERIVEPLHHLASQPGKGRLADAVSFAKLS
jgi:hypothetical protein